MNRAETKFITLLGVTVGCGLAAGLLATDSPWVERGRILDRNRLENIFEIAYEIRSSRFAPGSLMELQSFNPESSLKIFDPGTGEPYRYKATGFYTYEICVTFAGKFEWKATPEILTLRTPRILQDALYWDHPAGEHCYQFRANSVNPLPAR